jgi:hypothetical protein
LFIATLGPILDFHLFIGATCTVQTVETLQTDVGISITNWWKYKHYKLVEVETLQTGGGLSITNWWKYKH